MCRYIALRLWPESVSAFHKALQLAPNGSRTVPLQNVIQVQRKTCEWEHYEVSRDVWRVTCGCHVTRDALCYSGTSACCSKRGTMRTRATRTLSRRG